jgi:Phosphotransferase enzyme family
VSGDVLTVQPIDDAAELTPSWLESALRAAGFGATITDMSVEPVGTGQMSVSLRARYTATDAPDGLPASVVVKIPTPDRAMRPLVCPGYLAEVAFYKEVAGTLQVDVPRCFVAVANDDASSFTLVLEDMAPATQGDQIDGAPADAVAVAVCNLSGLHGPRWCDASWWRSSWLQPSGASAHRYVAQLVAGAVPPLAERLGSALAEEDLGTLEDAAAVMAEFLGARAERFAPIHGDYRLDNLLFGTSGRVTAVDWQTLTVGLPARDVAYLLGTSLAVEERRACEAELVGRYWEELVRHGVSGYSRDDCFGDYRLGMLQCPLIIVLGAAYGARTERGDAMFAAMIRRLCQAIRDLGSVALAAAEA